MTLLGASAGADLAEAKLAAAKLWLVSSPHQGGAGRPGVGRSGRGPARGGQTGAGAPRDLPYLAAALYALTSVPSQAVPRAAVDERWRLYLNPDWVEASSVSEVGGELAHLVWHLLLEHAARAREMGVDRASAPLWELAANAAVAELLAGGHARLPRTGRAGGSGAGGAGGVVVDNLRAPTELDLPPGKSAEEYFALLRQRPPWREEVDAAPTDCGSGADGIPRAWELPAEADVGTVDAFTASEIRRRVAIEYREHQSRLGCGDMGGEALRWVREVLEPRVPWEAVLTGAVRRALGWAAGRGDYTYSRPSRRAGVVPGVVLPGQQRPVPRVSVVIDTSGSMDDALLAQALGEIDGAIAALGVSGAWVTVYAVDAAVHGVQRVRRARDAVLGGAGGTDLRVGLAAVAAERPRPEVVIVLTDGETPWPTAGPPGAAVVIGVLGRRGSVPPPTPAWATRVEVRAD